MPDLATIVKKACGCTSAFQRFTFYIKFSLISHLRQGYKNLCAEKNEIGPYDTAVPSNILGHCGIMIEVCSLSP